MADNKDTIKLTFTQQAYCQKQLALINQLQTETAGALKLLVAEAGEEGSWDLSVDCTTLTRKK